MGTRGLVGLIIRGKRYAAYNHCDSYPSGLGKDIVKFLLMKFIPYYDPGFVGYKKPPGKEAREHSKSWKIYTDKQQRAIFKRRDEEQKRVLEQEAAMVLPELSVREKMWDEMAKLVLEIEWVTHDSTPSPGLQERYQKARFCDLDVGLMRPSDWYCLLRATQGAAMLSYILSGELKHAVDVSSDDHWIVWSYDLEFEKRTLMISHRGMKKTVEFKDLTLNWMDDFDKLANVEDSQDSAEWDSE